MHSQVVCVDVVTCGNWLFGKADDMPVAMDWFARGDGTQRNLVAGRDELAHSHLCIGAVYQQNNPAAQLLLGDCDIVAFVQTHCNIVQSHPPGVQWLTELDIGECH